MKQILFFSSILLIFIISCFNQDSSNQSSSVLLAGHLVEINESKVNLLGPEDVKWEIDKKAIIKTTKWDESFPDVEGNPSILEVKKGTIIKHGELEYNLVPSKQNNESLGCDCEVQCGGGRFCCAISGFKTKCKGSSCIKTTERC